PPKKPMANSIILIGFFYSLSALGVYMAFLRGSAVWGLLLGPIFTFAAFNVGHTVIHGGFAQSKLVSLFGRLVWDLGGYSSWCWDIEHQNHHQAPHTTIDVQTAPASIVRFFKHQPFRWYHRYQMFYIWFVLILYSPNSWIFHSYNTLFKYPCVPLMHKLTHVACKTVGFVIPITLSFYLFGFATAFRNIC